MKRELKIKMNEFVLGIATVVASFTIEDYLSSVRKAHQPDDSDLYTKFVHALIVSMIVMLLVIYLSY